jgi:hypothetical protein
MALDPQIPLSAAQQPSFAQQAGQTYQLAGAVEKQREVQEQRQDQQIIQEALKTGASFDTPDGLAKAAESLKGKVSPKTYQILTQAHQESKLNESKMQEYYAKAGSEVIDAQTKKLEFMTGNVEEPLAAYDAAVKEGKTPEEANLAFENAKAQKIQQISTMPQVGGQPVMPPEAIEQYKAGNPAQFRAKLEGVKHHQETLMAGAKLRKEEADIALSKERARALREGETGGSMDTEDIQSAGAQIAAGMPITQVIPGLGKGAVKKREAARKEGIRQIMEETPGMTSTEAGIELAQRGIDYAATKTGRMQQERTVGATSANISMASSEARKMVAIVKDVSAKMDLTEYPSINAVENAVSKGTGGTEIVRLNTALNSLVNTYARAINPKGVPTVEDKKEARIVINNAMSHGQILAVLDVMDQEMEASLASPAAARKILNRVKTLGGKEKGKPKESAEVPRGAAPAGAIEKLKKNPQLKEQFKAKYGYLPEGM